MTLTDADLDAMEQRCRGIEIHYSAAGTQYAEDVPALIAQLREARVLLAEVVAREIADEGWCAFCGFTFDNHAAGCLWVKARAYLQVAKCTSASPNIPAL